MTSWIRVVEDSVPAVGQRPVYLVRKEFSLDAVPASVTLKASAHGLYTAFVNGVRVGRDELTPGYTEYSAHTQYQSYEVAGLLQLGRNALVFELADGWYRGAVGLLQVGDQYGKSVELWAELLDASVPGVPITATDNSWRSKPSHILSADLFMGQVEDLTQLDPAAYLVGQDPSEWIPVLEASYTGKLVPQTVEPNRVTEYLQPKSIRRLGPATQVIDFGQNLNGWVRLSQLGSVGTRITLTHGEWLDANGDVTLENLHVNFPIFPHPVECHQIDTVISDGNADSVFEPRYTTHGFQFVRVEGLDEDLDPANVSAAAVHTDLKRLGHFASSDERLNWLHQAADWSFRGNACDVPTDCPTRERSGWTGDWQLYAETAAFLYDVREFNRKFLTDVRINQKPDGMVMNIAPFERISTEGIPGASNGSSGWGDVLVQAPLMIYRAYGDTDQLAENFDAMVAWIEFAANLAATARHASRSDQPKKPYEDYLWDTGYHWGEWMEAGVEFDFFKFRESDKGLVATAYLHRSARDAATIAKILGKPAAVIVRLELLAENSRLAWRDEYLLADGRLTQPSQANYARSLAFGLFPTNLEAAAAAELNRLVVENGYRLSTGFLTTPMLLPVLCDHGYAETAYRLLFQEQEPSWLAMRNRGATTIWEQWHGVDADGVPHESLNHYSKGAVISFLHQYLVGLKPLTPGYSRFQVKPVPTSEVDWVELSLNTPHGLIQVEWRRSRDDFTVEVLVPDFTEAEVTLPGGSTHILAPGEHLLTCSL